MLVAKTCSKTRRRYLNDLFVVRHLRSCLASTERSRVLCLQTEATIWGKKFKYRTYRFNARISYQNSVRFFTTIGQISLVSNKQVGKDKDHEVPLGTLLSQEGEGSYFDRPMCSRRLTADHVESFQSSMQTQQKCRGKKAGNPPRSLDCRKYKLNQCTTKDAYQQTIEKHQAPSYS